MLKKPLTAFFSVLLLNCAALAYGQTNSVTLTSFYPQPIGAYARLRIIPQNSLSAPCPDGSLYYDNTNQGLFYCTGTIWNSLSTLWVTRSTLGLDPWNPGTWVDQVYTENTYPNLTLRKPWIGIGTDNPQNSLHIAVNSPNTPPVVMIENLATSPGSPGPGANLSFYGPNGGMFAEYIAFRPYLTNMTAAAANALIELHLTDLGSENHRFSFSGFGFLGVNHFTGAPLNAILIANGQIGNNWTFLNISSNANPANSGNILTISPNGNIGINTSAPAEQLEVTGNIRTAMLILTSDAGLKKNIFSLKNGLEKLSKISTVSFDWKNSRADEHKHLGIIAQETEKIFPEIVYGQPGAKSVDYMSLISPLIESVKELKKANELLNQKFEEQSAKIYNQRQKINSLKESILSQKMTFTSRSNP